MSFTERSSHHNLVEKLSVTLNTALLKNSVSIKFYRLIQHVQGVFYALLASSAWSSPALSFRNHPLPYFSFQITVMLNVTKNVSVSGPGFCK
uniref:Uncharacterized protein n=1 Tax=Arion vulgaris TaxID=1028688 RepID=A0A0B7AGC2_9EUPU